MKKIGTRSEKNQTNLSEPGRHSDGTDPAFRFLARLELLKENEKI